MDNVSLFTFERNFTVLNTRPEHKLKSFHDHVPSKPFVNLLMSLFVYSIVESGISGIKWKFVTILYQFTSD